MKRILLLLFLIALAASDGFSQTVTGSITAAGSTCTPTTCVIFIPASASNVGTVTVQISGTFSGTNQFEASAPGSSVLVSIIGINISDGTSGTSATTTGVWQFPAAGLGTLQVRGSSHVSGTADVVIQSSTATARHPATGTGSGTVTSVATSAPITGGPITTSGTIACATCVVGPSSATDKAFAEFDTSTGKLLQDSGLLLPVGFGTSGYFLSTDGMGGTSWATGGGGGSPASPDTSIQFNNMGAFGGDAGFKITAADGLTANPSATITSGNTQFTGSGLNDALYSGTANFTSGFDLSIDGTGTPDTFTWVFNGTVQAASVPITGSAQYLAFGVSITFGATTGHTLNDAWDLSSIPTDYVTRFKFGDFNNLSFQMHPSGPTEMLLMNGTVGTYGLYWDTPQPPDGFQARSGVVMHGPYYDGGASVGGDPFSTLTVVSPSVGSGTAAAFTGITVNDITGATTNRAIKTGAGDILFGTLASATDSLPVCRHADGTLYSGTNVAGVAHCS